MFRLQTDVQDLLEGGKLTCRWLGRRPPDPRWIEFVEGRAVKVGMGRMSAQMAMTDTPFVMTTGLRIFRKLYRSTADGRAVEVFVFPAGKDYTVNLLRITDRNGRGEFQSLLHVKGRKQFRFADLGAAMRLALRIVNAGGEAAIARVLKNAEKEMTAA